MVKPSITANQVTLGWWWWWVFAENKMDTTNFFLTALKSSDPSLKLQQHHRKYKCWQNKLRCYTACWLFPGNSSS